MARYSYDFKMSALELSDDIGVHPAAVELGISYETLARWRKSRFRSKIEAYAESRKQKEDEASKIESLEREVQELKRTNSILLDVLKCVTAAQAN